MAKPKEFINVSPPRQVQHIATDYSKIVEDAKKLQALKCIRDPLCNKCNLHKDSRNRCIMGAGVRQAPIFLVGEAPGEAEEKSLVPFQGVEGKLLRSMLQSIGMKHECYISNICKCRPPGNRTPKPKEIEVCTRLYLNHELAIVRPRILVLLGTTATKLFFPWEPYIRHDFRWQVYKEKEYIMFPTWHPAYLIHNRSKVVKQQLYDTLAKAHKLANIPDEEI